MQSTAHNSGLESGETAPPPRLVSVIVPTCDRPAFLREALASIRALEQPDLTLEIIVADNGVDPETRAVVEAAGAVYVAAPGAKCASVARNAALRRATGAYLAFLDDDDQWLPGHLRAHLDLLEADRGIDAVIGRVCSADHDLRPIGVAWPIDDALSCDALVRRMLGGYFPQIGAVVARASVRESVGYFDERLIGGEDLDWFLRIAHSGGIGFAPVESVLFRQRRRGTFDALKFERAAFDRRVFLAHAPRNARLFASMKELSSAYYGTMRHHYIYFVDAAISRAARGDRAAALQAIAGAFYVFPLRAAYHAIAPRRLRMALRAALSPRRRKQRRAERRAGSARTRAKAEANA